MTQKHDDELEAMARILEGKEGFANIAPMGPRAAAMLRACKTGDAPYQREWNMDESEYGTLIYSLKQDGWRKGEPIMVNDVTIRIENANGSSHDLGPIAARILAALEPARVISPRPEETAHPVPRDGGLLCRGICGYDISCHVCESRARSGGDT